MANTRTLNSTELNELAVKLGAQILGTFNQQNENNSYALTRGQCSGISNFWLCLHLFNPVKSLKELTEQESIKLSKLKENYADVILMQKAFADPSFAPKESLSQLGVVFFTNSDHDAKFEISIPLIHTVRQRTEKMSLNDKAKALKTAVENATVREKFLSFQFNWTDDAEITDEYYRDSVDNRRQHGHRIAVINNPCPGCEILFFDANRAVYAFPTKVGFYNWLEEYFKFKLRHNGQPVAYARSIAIDTTNKYLAEKKLVNKDKDEAMDGARAPQFSIPMSSLSNCLKAFKSSFGKEIQNIGIFSPIVARNTSNPAPTQARLSENTPKI